MADAKQPEESEVPVSHSLPATSEQDRELALRATHEFDCGDYDNCLATVTKLAATRGHDLKVMHNQAVAAYYKSGLAKTDEFKRALAELYSKVRKFLIFLFSYMKHSMALNIMHRRIFCVGSFVK